MIPKYCEEVYHKLSKIVGLKFHAQIKNSGVELQKILKVQNLINDKLFYVLLVDGTQIVFSSTDEFLLKFCQHISRNLEKMDQEDKELQGLEPHPAYGFDYHYLHDRYEYIGHCSYKQSKLLEKLQGFLKNSQSSM